MAWDTVTVGIHKGRKSIEGEIPLVVVVLLVIALAVLKLLGELFRGAGEIQWSWLNGWVSQWRLERPNEDKILLTETRGESTGAMSFTLTVPPAATWWKAVEVYDANGRLLANAWTQDARKTDSASVPDVQLPGAFLVLKKAKFWGVHTSMYVIRDLTPKASSALTFYWERDYA